MKHLVRYLQVIPAALLIVACANEKEPVKDLKAIQTKAAEQEKAGPQPTATQAPQEPAVITKYETVQGAERVVIKPEIKNYEGNKITSDDLKWTLPNATTFSEGVTGKFTFTIRCALKDCTPALAMTGLPEGATFTPVASKEPSSSSYELTWTPRLGTVDKKIAFIYPELAATATTKNPKLNAALAGITKTSAVTLIVNKADVDVKEVAVTGLPAQVNENQKVEFAVTAKIDGIDHQGAVKPTLNVTPDVAGGAEVNGAGMIPPFQLVAPEYMGNSTWKFKLTFDTNNFVPLRKNTDTARAGMAFQVCFSGQCSDVKTAKVDIKFTKLAAPAIGGPAPVPADPAAAATVPVKADTKPAAKTKDVTKAPAKLAKKPAETATASADAKPAASKKVDAGKKSKTVASKPGAPAPVPAPAKLNAAAEGSI